MFAVILESMLPLQTNGFRWDFFYGGKLYEDIEFIPFVPFISCDTAEADKLCGKYSSRADNLRLNKQINNNYFKIFVTRKHEKDHVDFCTKSTGDSFFQVTIIINNPKIERSLSTTSLTIHFQHQVDTENISIYTPITLLSLGLP